MRAAHAALLESASLLDGAAPGTAAERDYLEKRIAAIAELTEALKQERETWLATSQAQRDVQRADERLDRTARAEAREEVEAILGESSLQELGDLTRQIKGERPSGGAADHATDGSGSSVLADKPQAAS